MHRKGATHSPPPGHPIPICTVHSPPHANKTLHICSEIRRGNSKTERNRRDPRPPAGCSSGRQDSCAAVWSRLTALRDAIPVESSAPSGGRPRHIESRGILAKAFASQRQASSSLETDTAGRGVPGRRGVRHQHDTENGKESYHFANRTSL